MQRGVIVFLVDGNGRELFLPQPVSRDVQGDAVEPGIERERPHPVRGIAAQRPIRSDEGVLRDLLGVSWIPCRS